MTMSSSQARPYWHVDLKWIFGILSVLLLTVSTSLFTLSSILSERIAVPLATYIVASQFSREGLDDTEDIEKLKKEFLSSGEETFYPFENNKNVSLSRSDIESLFPRDLRLRIFQQPVERLYHGGSNETTDNLKLTLEQKENFKRQLGLLALFNKKTHESLHSSFLLSLAPLVLVLVGLVNYSYRYGRLISLATVFLLVSTLPSLLFFLIQHTTPPPGDDGPFSVFPQEITRSVASQLSAPYYFIFITGLVLIALAIITKTYLTLKTRKT